MKQENLNKEYNEMSAKIGNEEPLPMYEWLLLSQYACQNGLESSVRAIKDSYRLGFDAGRTKNVKNDNN